jgi:hypothetical protein
VRQRFQQYPQGSIVDTAAGRQRWGTGLRDGKAHRRGHRAFWRGRRTNRFGLALSVLLVAGMAVPAPRALAEEPSAPGPASEPGTTATAVGLTNTEASVSPPPAGSPEPPVAAEVVGMRQAKAKTFATAEPGRYVSRLYAHPVHFKDAAGAWQDIDNTLVPVPVSGRLRTRANAITVELAPIASDPQLARVDFDADHSVGYRLHGAAPAPVQASGTLATYAAALPDVAVELRPFWGGLKEDLVLTSRAAPDTYLFPLTLRGLTAHLEAETGDVIYKDADGEVVGRTPHGSMEDSTPPRPTSEPNPPPVAPAHSDGVTYELVDHEGGKAIRMTLDRGFLDDPETTFPVRVDPTTTFNDSQDDTYVATNDTSPNDWFGDLNSGTETCCTNTIRYRSFMHFYTDWLKGRAKGIDYARIAMWAFQGYSCGAKPISMYRVTQGWDGSMATWPGAGVGEEMARIELDACPNGWKQWDPSGIADMVRHWTVAQDWSDLGVMVKAYDENDNSQWRRFYSANQPGGYTPHLVVYWWGLPNAPDNLGPGDATYTSPPNLSARYTHSDESTGGNVYFDFYNPAGAWVANRIAGACHGCTVTTSPTTLADGRWQWDAIAHDGSRWGNRSGRLWFTLDRKPNTPDQLSPATGTAAQAPPTLSARYDHTDPGNSSGQIVFKLYNSASTFLSETYSSSVCKGCTANFTPSGLADGLYRWEAVGYDGGGTSNPNAFSATSERRTFLVDTAPPTAPTLSSSTHPNATTWYPNRSLQSSWTAPSDPSGISGYAVAVDQTADTVPAANVTQTATDNTTTVAADGTWYVHVRVKDGAGNWSTTAHRTYLVDAATPGTPTVSSSTHPDPNAWYTDPDPTVTWSGGDTVSGLGGWSYILDQVAGTAPDTASEGTFGSQGYTAVPDGVNWFHVRRLNNAGTWGTAAHFPLHVDSTPPPAPSVSSSTHPDEPTWYANADPAVSWSATDTAPIDGYSWVLDQVSTTVPDMMSEGTGTTASWTGSCRHSCASRWQWLLAGRRRWWGVRLRRRTLLRVARGDSVEPADCRHGTHPFGERLLAHFCRRWCIHLR